MIIKGGLVFDLEQGFIKRDLYTDGTMIAETSSDDRVIHAEDCYVIPGLVDVHFHGCVGEDFSDATREGLQRIADYELSEGVAYICPTSMTLPEETLTKICENVAAHRKESTSGAEVVGAHLEGPFLSHAKRGAQNEAYLRDPDFEMLARLQQASNGCVKLMTMAPEQPGGTEFIRKATDLGVTVSVGHTTADYDTAMAAFAAGATHATHLYNGMPPIHHRAPAVIGAAFDSPGVRAELICDGIHIHPAMIRLTFRLFGAERVVLISDSLRATGMPDGQYPFGGQEIEVHGNRATIVGHPETLAGSVTSLMGCMKQAIGMGIPISDAVRAATYNPACAIGIDDRAGTLDIGKESTVVLLHKNDLSVRSILFKGNLVS